jgi:predicted transcriptional regulator
MPRCALSPYADPLIRIEYDEMDREGRAVVALLAPFSHAINALCYREMDFESQYNQKAIADICQVSPSEVTGWKKEERTPEKYRWFLLLVDISSKTTNPYNKKIVQPHSQSEAEAICNAHLRMVKACYDPFCADDVALMNCVWRGHGLEQAKSTLMNKNAGFWRKIFK